MTRPEVHPSELAWARWLSQERGGLSGWRFRRHLAACPACQALERELSREREGFEASPRRGAQLDRLRDRAARNPVPAHGWRGSLGPRLAGAGALLGGLLYLLLPAGSPELAAKGGTTFTIYVERPAGAAPLPSRCRPGDRLMARYRTSRPFLLLLERDGQGRVQVLFPREGASSARLPGAEGTTPTSWILDATPGPECFAAFFSDEPIDAAVARRALQGPEAPAAPGAEVQLRCCDKDPRP